MKKTNLRNVAIGLGRAYHDGRRRGFWIGVLVAISYHLLEGYGFMWIGLASVLTVALLVHRGRPS